MSPPSPSCAICLVRDFASDEQKDALIREQARQLDRLSHLAFNIPYVGPDPMSLVVVEDEEEPEPDVVRPKRSTLATVEAILNMEGVFRRPGRVAAPRVIEELAKHGIYLTTLEDKAS